MLPMQCQITKTNIGLKVLNYLPLTLTDFRPQTLFASRLTLRVQLLNDKHFFYNTFLCSIFTKFLAFQHGNICKICEQSKVASLFLKKILPKNPEFSLRLALFMDNLGEFPFPNRITCG